MSEILRKCKIVEGSIYMAGINNILEKTYEPKQVEDKLYKMDG